MIGSLIHFLATLAGYVPGARSFVKIVLSFYFMPKAKLNYLFNRHKLSLVEMEIINDFIVFNKDKFYELSDSYNENGYGCVENPRNPSDKEMYAIFALKAKGLLMDNAEGGVLYQDLYSTDLENRISQEKELTRSVEITGLFRRIFLFG